MATGIVSAPEIAAPGWLRRVRAIGPGLVFVLGALGPRDLVTNAIAGSANGASLMWILAVAVVMRMAIMDSSARYVMGTGESLLAGCGRLGRWVVYMWFAISLARRHVSALVRLTLLGTAAHFILPLPTRHSVQILGAASWTLGFALMFWGRYRVVEKVAKLLAAVLGASLVAAAILSKPDLAQLAREAFHPVMPREKGIYHPAILVMAILAAAMGSFSNLRYAAYVHEKGWRSLDCLKQQRTDMLLSLSGMFLMLAMIQVAAAGTLRPLGIQVREVEDLVPIFSTVMGDAGRILFGLTLWCVSFAGYVGNSAGYGIMISDVWNRFIRPSKEVIEEGKPAGQMPAYRWLVLYVFLTPLYVLFTDWTPIGLVLAYGVMSVVTTPAVALVVLRLTSDRKRLGEFANGWFTNIVLVLVVACSFYLSWGAAQELWSDLRKN